MGTVFRAAAFLGGGYLLPMFPSRVWYGRRLQLVVTAHMGTTLAMAAAKCAGQTRDGQCGR
jgi:hypothetical protein